MKEKVMMVIFCFVIFGISISTVFNQTLSLFKKDEKVSDVVKGHEISKEKQNKNKDKSAVNSMVDSFTENLTGKKEGLKLRLKSQRRLQTIRILSLRKFYLVKRIGYSIRLQMMGIRLRIIRVSTIMMRIQ